MAINYVKHVILNVWFWGPIGEADKIRQKAELLFNRVETNSAFYLTDNNRLHVIQDLIDID